MSEIKKFELLTKKDWNETTGELWREYIYPDGGVYRIEFPIRVAIKRNPEGDSHRVVDGANMSHYVRAGWMAIRWVGKDGKPQYQW